MAHQIGSMVDASYVDKRRKPFGDTFNHTVLGLLFTCNAGGSTTTLVGAVAVLNTGVNVARLGDRFMLQNAAGVPKEFTIFTVTAIGATGTPVTFTPAAAVATVSTDKAMLVDSSGVDDEASLDAALTAFNATLYSAVRLAQMTQNDKVYAFRLINDPTGV